MSHASHHHHHNHASVRKEEVTTRNINLYPFRDYKDRVCEDKDQPRRSVLHLLTSSLPFYIFKWLLLFMVNAGLWVLLLETGVLSEPGDRVLIFSTALDLIGFALGLIYWMWVSQGRDRMFDKAEQYEGLLADTESLAQRMVQVLPFTIAPPRTKTVASECADSRLNNYLPSPPPPPPTPESTSGIGYQPPPPTERDVCIVIEEIQLLLCASVNAFTFVMLNDPINMKHPKSHDASDLSLTDGLRTELDSYTPEDELEMAQYVGIMIEARIKRLCDWGALTGGSDNLVSAVEEITKKLHHVRTKREEQSYEYVNLFMITALTIVLFFFPYIIWPRAHLYTLLVYPVLMFIVAGLPLTINWYGDPFEGTPGDNAIDYRHKEKRSCNRIYDSFERYFRNSSCCYLGNTIEF